MMGNPNGMRTVFMLLPPMFILLPLSILIVALERISNALFTSNTSPDFQYGSSIISLTDPTATNETIDVTMRIRREPTLAILGLSLAAIVVSAIAVCGMWELRRIEGSPRHQRGWSWILLVLNSMTMVASVGLLAYLSVLQGNEQGWKSYVDVGIEGQKFTRETWACQINHFYPSSQSWAGSACGLEKGTRFMLIPLAISSALILVCTGLLIRDRGGAKWLLGGKGRYAAFDNVMELPHQGPVVAKGIVPNNERMAYQ